MSTSQRAAASLMEYGVRAAGAGGRAFLRGPQARDDGRAWDGTRRFRPGLAGTSDGTFAAGIRDRSQGWFVAAAGDLAVGSAAAFLARTVTAEIQYLRSATIAGVYVAPKHRRPGLARELVTRTIQWARERGCRAVRLPASPLGEQLYRSLGFEDGGELILKIGS